MIDQNKLSALKIALGQTPKIKGSNVIFFCPKHGANSARKEGQLSINFDTDNFHCWSCGFSGKNIYRLLILNGKTKYSNEYFQSLKEKDITLRCIDDKVIEDKKYDAPCLPDEFKTLSIVSESPFYAMAIRYLANRGLTSDDILKWKLGYAETGPLAKRIIIPSFDENGILNYVVGRSFVDDMYRYKPFPLHQSKNIIWNDYLIDWTKPVTITEGPFDAFTASNNVTILQGTFLCQKLMSKIVMNCHEVYFAMDADAFKKQLEHIRLLMSYGILCKYVDVKSTAKDISCMGKNLFQQKKLNAFVIKNEFDIMKLRLTA